MLRSLFVTCMGASCALGHQVRAEEIVLDFETATIGKPIPSWTEKGVEFKLASNPTRSKAVGRITFFPWAPSNRIGILNAMANEPIPVEAKLPEPAKSVTLVLWGSTGCAAKLEAFNADHEVIATAKRDVVPKRAAPGDPVPTFELTVQAEGIAYIQFSGPRSGEYLVADEMRIETAAKK